MSKVSIYGPDCRIHNIYYCDSCYKQLSTSEVLTITLLEHMMTEETGHPNPNIGIYCEKHS